MAFPAVSAGAYGYPKDAAARIAVRVVRKFLEGADGGRPVSVIFVCFSEESAAAHRRALEESARTRP